MYVFVPNNFGVAMKNYSFIVINYLFSIFDFLGIERNNDVRDQLQFDQYLYKEKTSSRHWSNNFLVTEMNFPVWMCGLFYIPRKIFSKRAIHGESRIRCCGENSNDRVRNGAREKIMF